jgi:exportin-2 (importin alpha re-exporter)
MESQLDAWMAEFHTFLTLPEPPSLAEPDPTKEAPLDALKAAVCANVNLFMETSEEEFAKFLQTFVTDVWHLLTSVSARQGQDALAMAATRFLTTVARSVHSGLFAEEGVLRQVCEAIVLPSLRARGDDEELFEFNPIEYIRRDAEGSDADTRRRAAADLLRALSERFEPQVAALAGGYVARLLQEYAAAPAANWAAKGAALQLVLAVAVRGRTGERGATRTSGAVDVGEFFASQVGFGWLIGCRAGKVTCCALQSTTPHHTTQHT